jgi:hypothetical protein
VAFDGNSIEPADLSGGTAAVVWPDAVDVTGLPEGLALQR